MPGPRDHWEDFCIMSGGWIAVVTASGGSIQTLVPLCSNTVNKTHVFKMLLKYLST